LIELSVISIAKSNGLQVNPRFQMHHYW